MPSNRKVDSFLAHHGILGQKWGVRRFQNKDGSLTRAGRERYYSGVSKNPEFKRVERGVIDRLSNTPRRFKKQGINISEIESRGGLNRSGAIACGILALQKYNEAAKEEPRITRDVIDSVTNSGCNMYGLEYRLKQPTSMAGKIGSDSKEKGIRFQSAANGIKDAVRYTAVSNTKDFVSNYTSIKKSLENLGYTETRCKNFFDKYARGESMHKAVQCTYKNPNGYEFELQIQTPASQAAKELKIPIYEERRKVGISAKRALELESQMRQLAEQVENPPHISRIR